MKIAVVYNRESQRVVNLFGIPNQEKYGLKAVKRITDALKEGRHQVIALEGDKDLLDRLEEFMPRVLKGERPGMVFNLSYGIQGQARYTHVPGMLEMAGIPYVGSGPLAHSLALDKVVAKMILKQHGIPTPDFAVLEDPDCPQQDLEFPLIVKPKNEALSFGIQVVRSHESLRTAAQEIFEKFHQPVLVERFIEGREINVGVLGNRPAEPLPPAELVFGPEGPQIYTYEDKVRKSGREVKVVCPAKVSSEVTQRAQGLALAAFSALGCYDCARVDMRMDSEGQLYVLELNSLPSLGEHGSYVAAAEAVGLDFKELVNRLVEVASARYFGTPRPPEIQTINGDLSQRVFSFLTHRRDQLEKRLQEWCAISSRTADPVGISTAVKELNRKFTSLGLQPRREFTNNLSVWTWETKKGLDNGTLLIGHVDVPLHLDVAPQGFHRDPELLYGEGVGSSRGPLVMLEFTLSALRYLRKLHKMPLGVLYYGDEGRDCRYSGELIRQATSKAKRVLVLRPGNLGDHVITQRRGRRKYRLRIEGNSRWPGKPSKKQEVFLWVCSKLQELAALSSRKDYISVSPVDLHSTRHPMVLPHRFTVTILVTYLDEKKADTVEERMRDLLKQKDHDWKLDLVSDRPPLKERRNSLDLVKALSGIAERWEIPLSKDSSVLPSVAGLVPPSSAVVCGTGPLATDLHTPREALQRISIVQRTLLLAEFLAAVSEDGDSK